ncbi:MAG TPA: glycosyltransferase family 4 protein [Solirubrobacteraceae bacterium]|nr:glycosyltransferase family 4 protein [Solirubrobacteraceae bacterium]
MRVLAVGNMYPPQSFGGYELVWRSAVNHMRARGHEVRVLTTDLRPLPDRTDDPDVHRDLRWYWRDHAFPKLRPRALLRLERGNAAILQRHLSQLRPDVVTWWSMGGMSLSLVERVRRAGLRAVGFVHDDWLCYGPDVDHWRRSFGGRKGLVAPLAERLTGLPARFDLEGAARWVFVSESTRARALACRPGLADTGVAHSGIDPVFLDAAPTHPWNWRLLYVGRIDERKGIDTAVDALTGLPRDASLDIVGSWDETEEDRLRERARALGLAERVRFAGQRTREELLAHYAECDAVVFPVRWDEPWGLVPLEAMGRGRPVVATGRGGSGEYLRDGENCLLFEAGDAAGLAHALTRLSGDEALRARLREGGLGTARRYTEPHFNAAVEREVRAAAGVPAEAALA